MPILILKTKLSGFWIAISLMFVIFMYPCVVKSSMCYVCILGHTGFFRLQGIKVLWCLQLLGYLRTLSLKFQRATSKIEVVLALPCWLFQSSWESQQVTAILLVAFWNFKFKVLKYPRNCSLHNTLIPWSLNYLMYLLRISKVIYFCGNLPQCSSL